MYSARPARTRTIVGTFFRAVDPRFLDHAISGSRWAGRYSRPDQPTLYLSCSVEGVEAAMIAHADARPASLEIVPVAVDAPGIVDVREQTATAAFEVEASVVVAPWQDVAAGKSSAVVGSRPLQADAAGANGFSIHPVVVSVCGTTRCFA